jgi:hypothetical protein
VSDSDDVLLPWPDLVFRGTGDDHIHRLIADGGMASQIGNILTVNLKGDLPPPMDDVVAQRQLVAVPLCTPAHAGIGEVVASLVRRPDLMVSGAESRAFSW